MVLTKLPVHGFVLAGGQSTRMGEDKALLRFSGRPMVEIALDKLRSFCTEIGIAGNRDDLRAYGEVIHEARINVGPAAGVEAGLGAATQPWALFVPVDVPLIPSWVLCEWVKTVVFPKEDAVACASYLTFEDHPQPAFCLLRRECLLGWSQSLARGERRLLRLLQELRMEDKGAVLPVALEGLPHDIPNARVLREVWFCNVNTPEELARAEAAAVAIEERAS